jgi:hypothetical protein
MADSNNSRFLLHRSIAQAPNHLNEALPVLSSIMRQLLELSLSPKEKFDLLNHLHQRYGHAFTACYASIQHKNLLPWTHITESSHYHQLQQSISTAYLQLLTPLKNIQTAEAHQIMATSMIRAITHLREIQLSCYQLYTPVPNRFWFQMHFIYRHATQQNLYHETLSNLSTDLPNTTLCQQYQSALLFSASNTARLDRQNIALLPSLLDEWAVHLALHETANNIDLYGFHLLSDEGPTYQTLLKHKSNIHHYRTFDMTTFISTLPSKPIKNNPSDTLTSTMFDHLKRTLCGKPRRRSPRVHCEGDIQLKIMSDPKKVFAWKKNNISPEGYGLEQKNPIHLHVGQPIYILDPDTSANWKPAKVCWLRFQKQATLHMGIQLT